MSDLILVFDVYYKDDAGVGTQVDSNISVELYEMGGSSAKETRTLGNDRNSQIVLASDGVGYFYTTTVNLTNYIEGPVTAVWYAKKDGVDLDNYTETLTWPSAGDLNSSTIKDYIRGMLGFPHVAIEIDDSQWNLITNKALDVYNKYMAEPFTNSLDLVEGQEAYSLPEIGKRQIINVEFLRKPQTISNVSDPLFGSFYRGVGTLDFDLYVLGTYHREAIRRLMNQEPEWRWDIRNQTLYISTGADNLDTSYYYCAYTYYIEYGLEGIPYIHYDWFKDYCLAIAKEMVGHARNKFSGRIPAPGGEAQLDGERMLEESKEMIEKLEERIRSMAPYSPPVIG